MVQPVVDIDTTPDAGVGSINANRAKGIPHTSEAAAFPLGGLGTGTVSIGARGDLRDWEIENQPAKGRTNPYSFFAIYAKPEGQEATVRVLEAARTGRLDHDTGYGFVAQAGLPRLQAARLHGEYPVARVDFQDDVLPVEVSLRAFNPLVPLNVEDSSLPAAVLRYSVTNPGTRAVDVTVVGSVSHTAGRGGPVDEAQVPQTVRYREDDHVRGLDFGVALPSDDTRYGTLSLTTTDPAVTVKPQWVVDFWPDGAQRFWDDLREDGMLSPELRQTLEDRPRGLFDSSGAGKEWSEEQLLEVLPKLRTGSLGIAHRLEPGETREFEFVLSWSFPNRPQGWGGQMGLEAPAGTDTVRNHYTTLWDDAWDAAAYLHRNMGRLEAATGKYVDAVYGGTLDPAVSESIGANVAALRSTTCFVVENPNPHLGDGPVFAAWEGSFTNGGACEGTCTHVWSYAQALAYLFPSLERSARRVEYLLETDEGGAQKFRTARLFGGPAWYMGPAVDGQLGTFLRLYREWRASGDDTFLQELWPAASRSVDFALREWDRDGDGLLDGELHNTYDIEFYGIEPLANCFLLAALRAGERMANQMGEPGLAERWRLGGDRVAEGMEKKLWNGAWYRQLLSSDDPDRYQYGEGVLSDHLLGQFHAYLYGLGEVLPPERIRSALKSIYQHNFRQSLKGHESTQRAYALHEEGGLLLASWPNGGRPKFPFVYSDEVWTGVEHQVAASLAFAGLTDEATEIERAVRARYDGTSRSPWNEIEWGNHYARSLSSWALLPAFTGAQWDGPTRTLSFSPSVALPLTAMFTTGDAWGTVRIQEQQISLEVHGGVLEADRLLFRGRPIAGPIVVEEGGAFSAQLQQHHKEEKE